MRRIIQVLLAATLLAALPAAAASAKPDGDKMSPREWCQFLEENDQEAYQFLATQPGGCESSIASVGAEALMTGAFPSNAAAVGNCKLIEAEVGGYPYAFYGNPEWTAYNRADCVQLLRFFHGGFVGG